MFNCQYCRKYFALWMFFSLYLIIFGVPLFCVPFFTYICFYQVFEVHTQELERSYFWRSCFLCSFVSSIVSPMPLRGKYPYYNTLLSWFNASVYFPGFFQVITIGNFIPFIQIDKAIRCFSVITIYF